ncbi:hypothetical protein [uncultured Roseibium sp.]|uniref:hypothetical protein n=1 Tax=uncultured Roseibium sp. TaxID=1936171 RepID=UPI0032179DF7
MTTLTPKFQSGPLSVTETMLRFRGRRYKLSHIENLILKRPLFLMGAGIGALIGAFGLFNADLLYWHEQAVLAGLALTLPMAAWPFGTLYIHSRTLSTGEGSITWFHSDLAKAQGAIEDLMVTSSEIRHPAD